MSTETIETESKENDSKIEKQIKGSDLRDNFKNRLFLPFIIPVVAAGVVALLGISFSRIFLAGSGEHVAETATATEEVSKPYAPLMWAIIITVIVLVGAALISLMKTMRGTSFVLVVVGILFSVTLAGAVLSGAGESEAEVVDIGRPTEPELAAADPANVLTVDALGNNQFQAKEFQAAAGVIKVDYVGKGGSHALTFQDPRFTWFNLIVNAGGFATDFIKLEPSTYYIYCPIPGHEEAGMWANLVVK